MIKSIDYSSKGSVYLLRDRFKFYLLLLFLASVLLLGYLQIAPLQYLKLATFFVVALGCLFINDHEVIKLMLVVFTFNALQRRILAGNAFYIENDYLILLPFVPMFILIVRNIRMAFSDKFLNSLIFFLSFLTTFMILSDLFQIGWGYTNFVLILLASLVSRNYFNPEIIKFIAVLGVVEALSIIIQRINMQTYDIGWCLAVRKSLVVNEICNSNSPRLWGTMESAINAGCFLATTFVILNYLPTKGVATYYKIMGLIVIFSGIFLTGSRTFIFLIPVVILFVSFKRRISTPSILAGSLLLFTLFTSLPTIATALNYNSRWTDRLSIQNISSDESLDARLDLINSFSQELTLSHIIFGSGIGTKSRGRVALDNGFFSLIIEIGFPLMIAFSLYIFRSLRLSSKISSYQFSVLAATLMLFLSNLSFSVFTGSSGLLFWLCLANIHNARLLREEE